MPSRLPRRRIVVVGAHSQSLLLRVERVPLEGETVLGWEYEEPLDGGKATNQAVAAARLGAPVTFVTVFGNDGRGDRIRQYLESEHVDLAHAAVTDGPTDVGFVLLPRSGVPAIVTAADRNLQVDKALVERSSPAFEDASCVIAQLEAPQEAAIAAFELARAHGATTILNPAPAARLDARLVALTDILVPNEHEAAFLAGRQAPVAELVGLVRRELAVPAVVVTAGPIGAFVAAAGVQAVHVPAPRVDAIDTTGAGDAFIGALSSRLLLGHRLVDAVHFAVDYAARSVTRLGTMPAYPTTEEMTDHVPMTGGTG